MNCEKTVLGMNCERQCLEQGNNGKYKNLKMYLAIIIHDNIFL